MSAPGVLKRVLSGDYPRSRVLGVVLLLILAGLALLQFAFASRRVHYQ